MVDKIIFHYVYLIVDLEPTTKKYLYLGVRSSSLPPELDTNYMGSSSDKDFKIAMKLNPNRFKKIVLEVFPDRKTAVSREIELHNLYDVGKNQQFYNKSKQTSNSFSTSGISFEKPTIKNTAVAKCPITGESLGRISTIDPRWATGEIIGTMVGSAVAICRSTGVPLGRVSVKDPRWATGEIISHRNGKTSETLKKSANAIYSNSLESAGRVDHDDPRWATGEIITRSKTTAAAKYTESNIKIGAVSLDDPRWATGEIVGVLHGIPHKSSIGTVAAKDSITGISLGRISTTDPRWVTGEVIHPLKKIRSTSCDQIK